MAALGSYKKSIVGLDVGSTDGGHPYFVMELVKGVPITEFCDKANLSTRDLVVNNINVGLMRFSDPGGPILFPVSYIDEDVSVIEGKGAAATGTDINVQVSASNDDAEELLASCTQALDRGETLLIFPEATRTVPGRAMKVYRGAARVALAARAPVQFVHLDCTPPTLSKSEHWYQIPAKRFCFRLAVGDTLDAADFLLAGEHQSLASRRLTQVMRRTLMDVKS